MTSRTFLGGCTILIAAIAGCYTGGDVTEPNRAAPAAGTETSIDTTTAASFTGVPCDVAQVLAKDCASCHAAKPSGGAPNSMMSYEDLAAPSVTDPSTDIAQMSITRMKDPKNPMPPDGASLEDRAVLESWYAAGMPRSTEVCDATPAPSVYDTPAVCTTAKTWTNGGSLKLMLPGEACNQCHDRGEGPSFTASGTVYATAHEPDDCYGTSSASVKVEITDATNTKYTASVNAAGNFYFNANIKMPYKARVISGSKSRAMSGAQKDGDCNKCHTQNGSKLAGDKQGAAPGRVMAP